MLLLMYNYFNHLGSLPGRNNNPRVSVIKVRTFEIGRAFMKIASGAPFFSIY